MRPRHGGDLAASIDASVNINPLGPPRELDAVFEDARGLASHYPEIDARSARDAWAQKLGVAPDELMIGNGASELISLLIRSLSPNRVVVFDPTYSEYANAASALGVEVQRIPLLATEDGGWRLPDDVAVSHGDLVFVCSPNNPTGTVVSPAALSALVATGARVVVDESFRALASDPQPSAIDSRTSGSITVTSLTKSYGVPGLRLGHLVADASTVAELERRRDPWSVNGIAAAAAEVLIGCDGYLDEARSLIVAERTRMAEGLAALGFSVNRADVPWLLVELPRSFAGDASDFVAAVRTRGIALRDASDFPNLGARFVRIGVRAADENTEVLAAIEQVIASRAHD